MPELLKLVRFLIDVCVKLWVQDVFTAENPFCRLCLKESKTTCGSVGSALILQSS